MADQKPLFKAPYDIKDVSALFAIVAFVLIIAAIVIKYINEIKWYYLNTCFRSIKLFFSLRMDNKKATKSGFFF